MLSIFMSCLINVKCDYDGFVIIFTLDVDDGWLSMHDEKCSWSEFLLGMENPNLG
jgi:hypothetical protein